MGRTRKTANLVNDLVGIDTTAKSTFTDIDFSGDLVGDGSELSGISAGLGTALSSDTTNPLSNIYYTNQVLEIDNTSTIDVPSTAKVAYTQYAEIQVNGTADLIIADGDDLVPDILGIGTTGTSSGTLAGGGGRLRADNITGKEGVSAPTFPSGLVVTGVSTFASISADAISADSFNSNSSLIVSGGLLVGTAATFNGNVNIAGVLTYDDVTNIDSVGLITARSGISVVGSGVTIVDGINVTSGGATISGGINITGDTDFNGLLKEKVIVTAGKLSDNTNIYLENGCVHIFTTAESTTSTPAIKYNATTNLKDKMSVGESVVVTLITTANASAYSANITIDGDTVTENWVGGSAPADGGSSGVDIHTFTIIKVASSGTTDQQLTVIANHSKTS
jgi:hypothetical protein